MPNPHRARALTPFSQKSHGTWGPLSNGRLTTTPSRWAPRRSRPRCKVVAAVATARGRRRIPLLGVATFTRSEPRPPRGSRNPAGRPAGRGPPPRLPGGEGRRSRSRLVGRFSPRASPLVGAGSAIGVGGSALQGGRSRRREPVGNRSGGLRSDSPTLHIPRCRRPSSRRPGGPRARLLLRLDEHAHPNLDRIPVGIDCDHGVGDAGVQP